MVTKGPFDARHVVTLSSLLEAYGNGLEEMFAAALSEARISHPEVVAVLEVYVRMWAEQYGYRLVPRHDLGTIIRDGKDVVDRIRDTGRLNRAFLALTGSDAEVFTAVIDRAERLAAEMDALAAELGRLKAEKARLDREESGRIAREEVAARARRQAETEWSVNLQNDTRRRCEEMIGRAEEETAGLRRLAEALKTETESYEVDRRLRFEVERSKTAVEAQNALVQDHSDSLYRGLRRFDPVKRDDRSGLFRRLDEYDRAAALYEASFGHERAENLRDRIGAKLIRMDRHVEDQTLYRRLVEILFTDEGVKAGRRRRLLDALGSDVEVEVEGELALSHVVDIFLAIPFSWGDVRSISADFSTGRPSGNVTLRLSDAVVVWRISAGGPVHHSTRSAQILSALAGDPVSHTSPAEGPSSWR